MREIIILRGLPGSGKTTYAKQLMADNPGKYKRVNKDELRSMLDDGKHSKVREKFICDMRNEIIAQSILSGADVIVDDTNFNPVHIEDITNIAIGLDTREYFNVKVTVKDIHTSVAECIERDSKREKPVGAAVIRKMARENNIFDTNENTEKLVQDKSLPHAIICDLDGTLALMNGRNPYDASTCCDDDVNESVLSVIKQFEKDVKIIFVTGRKWKYADETVRFLNDKCNINSINLYTRSNDDNRKDSIVKREIFDKYIRDKYYVEFVLDDRNQVVEMWRDLGLTCFQVADGNF
jgi:predicted kinase